jgi:hypothetical protein
MAHKKFGVKPAEWWKHMRWMKRPQEKRVRQDARRQARDDHDRIQEGAGGTTLRR